MTRETCATCKAFDPIDTDDNGYGYCRLRAPAAQSNRGELGWPVINDDDWCLEHIQVVNSPDVMGEAKGPFSVGGIPGYPCPRCASVWTSMSKAKDCCAT